MSSLITLNDIETRQLSKLESVIERGQVAFIEVGKAMREIRDSRLYRETHETFEVYCQDRWSWTRRHTNRVIKWSTTAERLGHLCPIPVESPTHLEPLSSLQTDEEKHEAWCKAHEIADDEGRLVTGEIVQRAVEIIAPKKFKKESERASALSHADKAIGWLDEINLNRDGSATAIRKVLNHCRRLLNED